MKKTIEKVEEAIEVLEEFLGEASKVYIQRATIYRVPLSTRTIIRVDIYPRVEEEKKKT